MGGRPKHDDFEYWLFDGYSTHDYDFEPNRPMTNCDVLRFVFSRMAKSRKPRLSHSEALQLTTKELKTSWLTFGSGFEEYFMLNKGIYRRLNCAIKKCYKYEYKQREKSFVPTTSLIQSTRECDRFMREIFLPFPSGRENGRNQKPRTKTIQKLKKTTQKQPAAAVSKRGDEDYRRNLTVISDLRIENSSIVVPNFDDLLDARRSTYAWVLRSTATSTMKLCDETKATVGKNRINENHRETAEDDNNDYDFVDVSYVNDKTSIETKATVGEFRINENHRDKAAVATTEDDYSDHDFAKVQSVFNDETTFSNQSERSTQTNLFNIPIDFIIPANIDVVALAAFAQFGVIDRKPRPSHNVSTQT